MAIPKLLNDLLDYDDLLSRTANANDTKSNYIYVKKGKKEEAWAVCMLLGMYVDGDVEVDGHPVANTYIFVPWKLGSPTRSHKIGVASVDNRHYVNPHRGEMMMVGVEGRFNLRDLRTYFKMKEEHDDKDRSPGCGCIA